MSEYSSEFVVVSGGCDEEMTTKSIAMTPTPSPRREAVLAEEVVLEEEETEIMTVEERPMKVASVMPSTMARAEQIVDTATPFIKDVAEVGTSVTAGAIAGKVLHKPTKDNITNATAIGSVLGKSVGESLTKFMSWFFPLVAQHCGAHQCDHCGAENLYNYYKMKSGKDLDLCPDCFIKCGSGVDLKLDQNFNQTQLTHHDNTLFTLKIFLGGVALAVVAKQLFLAVFGK